MFHPVLYQEQKVGSLGSFGDCKIFYGNRFLKREDLKKVFPDFEFYFVKQVHGKKVIPKTSQPTSADGHFTDQKNEALVIQTADCLPLFLWDSSLICAVHAGWRGVAQKIVLEALRYFSEPQLNVSIGPHISQENFEVGEDVAQKLVQSAPNGEKYSKKTENRFYISLKGLVQEQIGLQNYYLFDSDTFSTKSFHSFRRTAEKLKGQYSFIVRV